MVIFAWILLGLWAHVCGVWAALLILQQRVRREGLMLEPVTTENAEADGTKETLPSVCVVVPVRNEGRAIEPCLSSVLAQDWPRLSVVVVDDRSEDDTTAVVEEYVRKDHRCRLVRVAALPDGWMGKSHALWTGTRDVTADWLLFVDGDCTLDPRAVRTVVHEAVRRNVDLLSLWPRHDACSFWEHMLIPLCAAIVALWFGSPEVNRTGSTRAFANGQFLLIRRSEYERVGGHRAVRRALIEDIPLAEHAAAAGLRLWVGAGQRLVAVRMYTRYAAIRDGWARIYVGALRSGWKIALSILWLLAGSLLPFIALAVLAVAVAWRGGLNPAGSPLETATLLLGSLHIAFIALVSYRFWGWGNCRRSYLWLYPVSVLGVVAILVRAWWWLVVCRCIPWRGRRYSIDRHGAIVC